MSEEEKKLAKEKLVVIAAEKNKAMDEAHQKYVETIESAKNEYIKAKKRIYPELYEAQTVKELQEKVKLLETEKKELEKRLGG